LNGYPHLTNQVFRFYCRTQLDVSPLPVRNQDPLNWLTRIQRDLVRRVLSFSRLRFLATSRVLRGA